MTVLKWAFLRSVLKWLFLWVSRDAFQDAFVGSIVGWPLQGVGGSNRWELVDGERGGRVRVVAAS